MSKKILIVEDNPKNRLLLKDILVYLDYDVSEAEDGAEGVKMANEKRPALIFMDMQMPVLNGFEAIKILKNDPATQNIKIIATTSFAMVGDREKCIEAGADEYISKPINTREISGIVKRLLGEK